MKTITWLVILVVVAGAAYYFVVMKGGPMTVTLAEQNSSKEMGTAVLKEVNGNTEVTVTMKGQPAGVAQPAHIHKGSCPAVGDVLYPLTSPKDGAASVTVLKETTIADLKTHPALAINVHKSAAESNVYVACGNLVF